MVRWDAFVLSWERGEGCVVPCGHVVGVVVVCVRGKRGFPIQNTKYITLQDQKMTTSIRTPVLMDRVDSANTVVFKEALAEDRNVHH